MPQNEALSGGMRVRGLYAQTESLSCKVNIAPLPHNEVKYFSPPLSEEREEKRDGFREEVSGPELYRFELMAHEFPTHSDCAVFILHSNSSAVQTFNLKRALQ